MPTEDEIRLADLNAELQKWKVLGIDPAHWVPAEGVLGMVVRLEVVTDILVEAGLFDYEDAQARFQEKMVQRLKEVRAALEPQIQQAKLESLRRNGNIIPPPGYLA